MAVECRSQWQNALIQARKNGSKGGGPPCARLCDSMFFDTDSVRGARGEAAWARAVRVSSPALQ